MVCSVNADEVGGVVVLAVVLVVGIVVEVVVGVVVVDVVVGVVVVEVVVGVVVVEVVVVEGVVEMVVVGSVNMSSSTSATFMPRSQAGVAHLTASESLNKAGRRAMTRLKGKRSWSQRQELLASLRVSSE